MILNEKNLKILPFEDSRGESGMSGKLCIAEAPDGTKYLVKSKPADVSNEYVAHKLARLIGVPTSDAVLIESGENIKVGITYESDFKRIPWNDFLGTQEYKEEISIFPNGEEHKTPIPTEAKYPDDDPLLAEFMAYLSFRDFTVMEDIVQLALSGGHLISFDYAGSFNLDDVTFSNLLNGKGLSRSVGLFANHLHLVNGYRYALKFLHRPESDFLLDAYLAPVFAFQEANFQPIFDELDSVFPPLVSAFYAACFALVKTELSRLGK